MFTSRFSRACGWLLLAIAAPMVGLCSTSDPGQFAAKIFSRSSAAPVLRAPAHALPRAVAASKSPDATQHISLANKAALVENYGNLPMSFDASAGQVDERVKSPTPGGGTSNSLNFTISASDSGTASSTVTALAIAAGGSSVTTVASGSVVTLTATVLAGSTPVTVGQVNFCDATASSCTGTHLIGSAQLTSGGAAALKFVPAVGSHSYEAVFAGTGNDVSSTSPASPLTVTASGKQSVTISLAQSGSAGNLTLTATVAGSVTGSGSPAPTGSVSFVDTSNGNAVLGTAPLGTGSFGQNTTVSQTPTVALDPKTVLVGDMNGDGIPDIVVGGNSVVSVLIGNGDGTFRAADDITAHASNPWIAVVPFVNGGPLDILAVSDSASDMNNATLIIGNGSGGGTAGSPFSLPFGSASGVVSGDFNGDGQQDFAVIFQQDNKISTFLGNGNGTFQAPTTLATGSAPVSAVVGNFNGHGKIDVAVANSGDNTISIYLGSVGGEESLSPFTVATPVQATFSPISIAVGDFNGDGIDDLAVTGTVSGNSVSAVFLGKGGGAFGTPTLIPQFLAAFGIVAADVLGNGDVDIVTTIPTGNALGLLLNDGFGDFSQGVIPPQTGNSPMFLAAGNFNGQASADLAVANNADGTVSVFLSQLTQSATASISGVSGAGVETLRAISGSILPQTGGDNIVAQYAGDANFAGATSTPIVVVVSNPVPTITNLSPTSAAAGSAPFTLTVNGTNFVSGATVSFGGANKTTVFVNSTQVTASILASDVASAGTPAVTVTNPTPGGGTSNALTFTINAAANNPVPAISTLQPASATAGSGALTLTVNGSSFVSGAVVNFNGNARTTTFVSATKVTASILAGDVASAGTPAVTVTNPAPGGGTSNALTFTINAAANNPTPAITTLQPASATAGSGAFTLTVNGSSFVSGAVVNFNGNARTTTFVSATKVTAAILAGDVAAAGTPAVTVTNPAPGGGTSNALTFTINAAANPVPAISTLQPASATAGSGAFTLTVNGSSFVHGAVVNFNSSARTTTFVSASQVTASILATDVASTGTPAVTVTNPAPGGGTSNALTFTISAAGNPAPTLTGLQPSTVSAGTAVSLMLTGTNFISTSIVKLNGTALATTFTSATQLMASVSATAIATTGTPSVTVFNPTPGGGSSSGLTLTIVGFSIPNPPAPQTVMAGQPASFTIPTAPAGAGPAVTLSFSASGLPTGAVATFNPSSVTAGTSTILMVTTTARTNSAATHEKFDPPGNGRPAPFPAGVASVGLAMMLAGLSFMGLARKPLRRFAPTAALILLIVMVGYLAACTGSSSKGNPNGTPAGMYTITVKVTSPTGALSTNATLIVQ
jgi:Bacterial Ig-like domain (group 3)/FG-GAP-like repeat